MTADVAPPSRRPRTSPGGVVLIVVGVLLTVLGGAVLAGGVAAASGAGRDANGWFTSPTTLFATDTYALTTPRTGEFTGRAQPLPFDVGEVRIRVSGQQPVFVGIARGSDVARYLADAHHTQVTEVEYAPFRAQYRDVPGTTAPADPAAQTFWTESTSGSGRQQLTWTVQPGDWTLVVMNQDGSAGVSALVQGGFRSGLLAPIAAGVIISGVLLLAVGVALLLLGTAAIGRTLQDALVTGGRVSADRSPVRLTGRAGEPLSRWLWLVKWVLAVPHYLVLALLWVAFTVTTIAAGFVVLFTGRYPRSWFAFDVGVLRWSWRVAFYSYSALGTDRYPPFSFASADYPADLTVLYPDRLTNGLVLVKWWLLAIPHLLVLAALTGGALVLPTAWPWNATGTATGLSVLGVLVLVAAVLLLFTDRYPRGLFDLVLGINRWAFRVAAYTALLRDEYPPFRLDQGPDEPTPASMPVAMSAGSSAR